MAAKRSPILGYNHNVRYRGLVFHVQTEDSGVMSPHLFTHMFHGGVIVSTRKLVYDAGSAEDSIKSLMQAQHKAVLKDLKRGLFDDKIDEYLGTTEGLLPRGARDVDRPSMPEIEVIPGDDLEPELPPVIGAPTIADVGPPLVGTATIMDVRPDVRASTSPDEQEPQPPPPMDDLPTAVDTRGEIAAAVTLARTVTDSTPEIEIQLEVDDDRDDAPVSPSLPRRASRDTEVQPFADPTPAAHLSDGIPRAATAIGHPSLRATMPGVPPPPDGPRARTPDSIPPVPPVSPPDKRIGASSLPPMRQPARPPSRPALVSPTVVSRPVTRDDSARPDPDSVEVYAPPPSAGQDPPDRPGQYSLRRSAKMAAIPVEVPRRERSAGTAIPSGLSRPGRSGGVRQPGTVPPGDGPPPGLPATPGTGPIPRVRQPSSDSTVPVARPPVERPNPIDRTLERTRPVVSPLGARTATPASAPLGARTATPSTPPASAPVARPSSPALPDRPRTATPAQFDRTGRTPTPARVVPPHARSASASSSGVVMTRPAVIVGAPPKSTQSRVRKASEESRGFGQGLISEKSLDEVILAYLSEDAEDK